ncbi:MAG: HNH endonuclease, partial [Actinomyces sp.]
APFTHTHAHHVEPYASGGRTDIDQLASVCAHCHTQIHTGIIHLRRHRDGTWYPIRIDPGEKPAAPGGGHRRGARGSPPSPATRPSARGGPEAARRRAGDPGTVRRGLTVRAGSSRAGPSVVRTGRRPSSRRR